MANVEFWLALLKAVVVLGVLVGFFVRLFTGRVSLRKLRGRRFWRL
ncbi:hypothetical protein ACFQ4O_10900 [Methylopila musalis]|uniref:Uncharacterized protein n=1 Tax=Methylopila musalis TaxID=1134781 RepID=A0ABW3Z8K0_9HYPH